MILVFSIIFCASKPPVDEKRTPELPQIQDRAPESSRSYRLLVEERFDTGIEGWQGFAEEGSLSEVSWDPSGRLLWSVKPAQQKTAALVHKWPDPPGADGFTLSIRSLDRSAYLVLGVQENDGSAYSLALFLEPGSVREYQVSFTGFGLQSDSEDENKRLDQDQLKLFSIVDISSFLEIPRPNRVVIDEFSIWSGMPDPPHYHCPSAGTTIRAESFTVGVDANFVPQGERHGRGFFVGEKEIDPIELFASNGVGGFRLRLWVGNKGESKLHYATDLALRALEAGLKPYLVLFLSEGWSDVNSQPAPEVWAELSLDERAKKIELYSYETAQHFIDRGIELGFYEIGNEIDYGICGVFADTTKPRDAASLGRTVWPDEALLIRAAVDGVRRARPDARIMLHIANSWSPGFASSFFRTMIDLGVDYDYSGLSFYPTAFGMITSQQFCETLDRLSKEIGKPIIIAETAYPAEPPTGGMFVDWRRAVPGYPLTPQGQAWWIADFLKVMRDRGDVLGVYIFSPGFWFSGELWSPFALFDGHGRARPAVASLNIDH
jgi:arabinogalactan endo-1,4-beta-galactosidase